MAVNMSCARRLMLQSHHDFVSLLRPQVQINNPDIIYNGYLPILEFIFNLYVQLQAGCLSSLHSSRFQSFSSLTKDVQDKIADGPGLEDFLAADPPENPYRRKKGERFAYS
jgi:hypothetical protein